MQTPQKPVILCVDDTPANLTLLNAILSAHYTIKLVNNGQKALDFLSKHTADLILLDVMMPDLNGYEVCQQLRHNPKTKHTPILFLTAKNTAEDEQEALRAGGNDFITKPINPQVLMARVKTHLALKDYQNLLEQDKRNLETQLQSRLSDIYKLQDASLAVMISLAEFRDECTGNHIKRTQQYITRLAKEVAISLPQHALSEHSIELISKCAPLHDIGKVTTPDHILLKPGKLTDDEFAIMKQHAQKGYDILAAAANSMGEHGEFLIMAQEIAISHHEKWNGTGYPHGLATTQIPLSGRMMAIVDVYDALRSARPYKAAFSHEQALTIMQEQAGQHFDPELFECFLDIQLDILAISKTLED